MRSGEGGKQRLSYFMSKVLTDVETRHTDFELIALALRTAIKKLHPYFQSHAIVVLTNHPIRVILDEYNLYSFYPYVLLIFLAVLLFK